MYVFCFRAIDKVRVTSRLISKLISIRVGASRWGVVALQQRGVSRRGVVVLKQRGEIGASLRGVVALQQTRCSLAAADSLYCSL